MFRALAVAALLSALPAAAGARIRPADISARIDKDGAATTIAGLVAKHKWHRVLAYIGTGKPGWLPIAPRLAAGADAGQAQGLAIALADALPRNAAGVLEIASHAEGALAIQRVCSAPYIDPEHRDLIAYDHASKQALDAVSDVHLREARRGCLGALHAGLHRGAA